MHATTDPGKDNKERVVAAQQREQELMAALVKQQKKTRDLVIIDHLDKNASYQRAQKKIKDLRHRIHKARMVRGRKRFSLQRRTEVIERIKLELAKCDEQDTAMAKQLEALEADAEQIKDQLAEHVAAKATEQTAKE